MAIIKDIFTLRFGLMPVFYEQRESDISNKVRGKIFTLSNIKVTKYRAMHSDLSGISNLHRITYARLNINLSLSSKIKLLLVGFRRHGRRYIRRNFSVPRFCIR